MSRPSRRPAARGGGGGSTQWGAAKHTVRLTPTRVRTRPGMIMWPKAKRAVSDATAKAIASTALAHGAQPVGVFVDEDAQTIVHRCARPSACVCSPGKAVAALYVPPGIPDRAARSDAPSSPPPSRISHRCALAGISTAQLHGAGARASQAAVQASGLQVVYVQHVTPEGETQTAAPTEAVDWVLLDGLQVRRDGDGGCCVRLLSPGRMQHSGEGAEGRPAVLLAPA